MMLKQYYRVIGLLVLLLVSSPVLKPVYAQDEENEETEKVKVVKGREKSLTLGLGVSRTLEFPFEIGGIDITDPELIKYTRITENGQTRKLLMVPKNSGTTDMTIKDTTGLPRITYTLRVTREEIGQVVSQLEELLGDVEGLKIKPIGGTIILDGDIILPKDMLRINRVLDALKERDPKKKETPIRNLATISKVTMNIIAERIEREIGSPEVTARVINNNLFLEGTAESDFEADRAVEIAKTYLPEVIVQKTKGDGVELKPKASGGEGGGLPTIIDLLRIRPRQAPPPAQDIKVTINYVELNNEYEKSFNFEWKPLASDSSTVKFDSALGELSANFVATVSSLLPKLISDKSHQHARVLKQQTLIVKDKSDSPGSVDSSIDIYTRIVDDKGNVSLQPIQVQNTLKVKAATIPGSDSIDLGVQLSYNSLLGTNNGSPIIARNAIQTQVNVKNGESAALGGYAVDNALAGYNREPTRKVDGAGGGSGSTPLFNLTRSKGFRHDKQQYVIFVTPEVIRTASAGTEDITRKFRLNAGEK
jgi:pilus assembly protein CpaC